MGNKHPQNFQWQPTYTILQRNFSDNTLTLQNPQSKQQYIGRELISTDRKQSEQIKRLIQIKYQHHSPFLTKLVEVYYSNDQAYCAPEDKIYLVFGRPRQTLRQEILGRKFANQGFTEEQADIILESGAKAIRALKEMQHPHNNISTAFIYIDNDRRIMLGDPWIAPPAYNQQMSQNVYACPSPQKILLQNDQIMSICPYRSDLFSLGTVVLQALNYEHMDILYEKGFRKLLQPKVKQKLSKIKSQDLRYKLSVVLSHDPQNREEIYALYRTNGLVGHSGEQGKGKVNGGNWDKGSPIAELSKEMSMNQKTPNIIGNLVQTQYIPTQPSGKNTYQPPNQPSQYQRPSNTITINNQPYSNQNPSYPSTKPIGPYNPATYIPTPKYQFNTIPYSATPTYLPTSTTNIPNNIPYNNPTYNYQHVNYMTHTPNYNILPNPTHTTTPNSILTTTIPNIPTFTGTSTTTKTPTPKPQPPPLTTTTIQSNITNENNETVNRNLEKSQKSIGSGNGNGKEQIGDKLEGSIVQVKYQIQHQGCVGGITPVSIKSQDDLVNTSANIRYIENSSQLENSQPTSTHIGNYKINPNLQSTPIQTNPQPQLKPSTESQPQPKSSYPQPQPQLPQPNPNKQTPQRKPTRKYNSTIKEQADQYSYSGSRDGDEEYQYVIEEYEAGRYEGQKWNGMRNGFGKFYYKEGSVYEGQWKDNLMNGKGNLYYANGKLAYQGDWRMDQFHGFGKVYNVDQLALKGNYNYNDFVDLNDYWASYEGELHSDRRHGKGKIKFSNGQIFVGQFIADSVEGPGKFYTLNGEIIQGIWKNNKLIRRL